MRRSAVVVTVVAVIAGAVAVAATRGGAGAKAPIDAAVAAGQLTITAGTAVTPIGRRELEPGGDYRYEFRVTNRGRRAVRSLVARSEKVEGGRAGAGLQALTVSDPSCVAAGRVICSFDLLAAGESRGVQVTARSAKTRRPGDVLTIHTYLAAYAPVASGRVTFKVLGQTRTTTGVFGPVRPAGHAY
ncbi:hypothetical protein [Spirillospora sp. CA-294931]|uniref:hypothetical protein n=1 Tax=Spirillospora sp. CA-294931 TaxID=3240042 RepID=UPI003D8AC958